MRSALTFVDTIAKAQHPADTAARVMQETDDIVAAAQRFTADHTAPPSNLLNTWEAYVLQIALPGIDPQTVHIDVQYRHVSIDGKYQIPPVETGTYLRHGIAGGELHEVFDVPAEVDGNRAEAIYDCGILTLTLPKVAHLMHASIQVHTVR